MGLLTVTLPDDVIDEIRERVAAGDYASESDLVRDSLETFVSPDVDLDEGQIAEIRASCAEMAANPALAVPIDDVLPRIKVRAKRRAANEDR